MKNTLAFQITALYRDFLSYTTGQLKQLGLSFGQMPIILYTGKHTGCTHSDLTRDLSLDWGYSQRAISRLVDSGFLTKTYDAESACNRLALTERGTQAFQVCHRVFPSWDQEKLKDFSAEEKELVLRLLSRITA